MAVDEIAFIDSPASARRMEPLHWDRRNDLLDSRGQGFAGELTASDMDR